MRHRYMFGWSQLLFQLLFTTTRTKFLCRMIRCFSCEFCASLWPANRDSQTKLQRIVFATKTHKNHKNKNRAEKRCLQPATGICSTFLASEACALHLSLNSFCADLRRMLFVVPEPFDGTMAVANPPRIAAEANANLMSRWVAQMFLADVPRSRTVNSSQRFLSGVALCQTVPYTCAAFARETSAFGSVPSHSGV